MFILCFVFCQYKAITSDMYNMSYIKSSKTEMVKAEVPTNSCPQHPILAFTGPEPVIKRDHLEDYEVQQFESSEGPIESSEGPIEDWFKSSQQKLAGNLRELNASLRRAKELASCQVDCECQECK